MVTGKGVQSGNNVSHANNRTRRRFLPNIQDTSVYSEVLGRKVSLRVSINGLRTLEHKGGIDAWLSGTAPSKLEAHLRPLRKQIVAALAEKRGKAAAAK
jgi:large subunit ribosomal protein L28